MSPVHCVIVFVRTRFAFFARVLSHPESRTWLMCCFLSCRRSWQQNVCSGSSLRRTGTTPTLQLCTSTQTRGASTTWPWTRTARPERATGLKNTRNSPTSCPGRWRLKRSLRRTGTYSSIGDQCLIWGNWLQSQEQEYKKRTEGVLRTFWTGYRTFHPQLPPRSLCLRLSPLLSMLQQQWHKHCACSWTSSPLQRRESDPVKPLRTQAEAAFCDHPSCGQSSQVPCFPNNHFVRGKLKP